MAGRLRLAIKAAAVAFACAFATDATAQTLREALQGLVETHPAIASGREAVDAATSGRDRANANYLPRLDVTTAFGPQYIDSPLTSSAGGGEWVAVAQIAGVEVSQVLFDGFATPARVAAAGLQTESARFGLAATRQQVLLDGIGAYLDVVRHRRLVELARASERTIKSQLRLEDERVRRGAGIAVDVLQAKSRLQVAKEQRIGFEGALRLAISHYLQVFAQPPEIDAMAMPPPPVHLIPDDLHGAIVLAQAENPAVNASLAQIAEAAEGRRIARGDYYPTFDLVAGANYEKDTDLVEGVRTDLSLLLRATWNLFDGFATDAAAAEAAAVYRGRRDDHEALERRVGDAVRAAWHTLNTAREREELLENGVAIAEQVFAMRRKLRAAGRETAINVLDAEDELTRARIALTAAQAEAQLSVYRLIAAIGRLGPRELALAVGR
ncbi:MAG: TolC family protein [Rhodospirillales bacterium]|nr:TolC family protein [Rhodospirillales bacterium]